jgi:hypothetical protein
MSPRKVQLKGNEMLSSGNGSLDLFLGLSALTETVLEATVHLGQVAHATSTGGLSALALHTPVVCLKADVERESIISFLALMNTPHMANLSKISTVAIVEFSSTICSLV